MAVGVLDQLNERSRGANSSPASLILLAEASKGGEFGSHRRTSARASPTHRVRASALGVHTHGRKFISRARRADDQRTHIANFARLRVAPQI